MYLAEEKKPHAANLRKNLFFSDNEVIYLTNQKTDKNKFLYIFNNCKMIVGCSTCVGLVFKIH